MNFVPVSLTIRCQSSFLEVMSEALPPVKIHEKCRRNITRMEAKGDVAGAHYL